MKAPPQAGPGGSSSTARRRIKARFMVRARRRRMDLFLEVMSIRGGERIVDLGGTVPFWDACPYPLDLTLINLPGVNEKAPAENSRHRIALVEGDACDLRLNGEPAFDIAFSNSVIEHVGPPESRRAFARGVRALAPRYWVQTPAIWFPIEPHNHMLFWWAYPAPIKEAFLRRWRRQRPRWTNMIETTAVVREAELRDLFPDSTIWVERYFGLTKSYVAYRS